jgi:hypothetical protein
MCDSLPGCSSRIMCYAEVLSSSTVVRIRYFVETQDNLVMPGLEGLIWFSQKSSYVVQVVLRRFSGLFSGGLQEGIVISTVAVVHWSDNIIFS